MKMMFGGEIPGAFKSVIVELFKGIDITYGGGEQEGEGKEKGLLAAVREEIDPAKLFFGDFGMLEVDEDASSIEKRRRNGMTMDCFRKGWLVNPTKTAAANANGENGNGVAGGGGPGKRWRRCARCAAVTEDVLTPRQALQWLVMQQRRCFCSGHWDTLAVGEMVA